MNFLWLSITCFTNRNVFCSYLACSCAICMLFRDQSFHTLAIFRDQNFLTYIGYISRSKFPYIGYISRSKFPYISNQNKHAPSSDLTDDFIHDNKIHNSIQYFAMCCRWSVLISRTFRSVPLHSLLFHFKINCKGLYITVYLVQLFSLYTYSFMCEKVTDAFKISKPKNCVKRL